MGELVIGIDLGTTNSVVATVQGGAPTVIPNRSGYRITPSVVAMARNGKRLVGALARRQAVTNAERTVVAVKRLMGRRWSSKALQEFCSRKIAVSFLQDILGRGFFCLAHLVAPGRSEFGSA